MFIKVNNKDTRTMSVPFLYPPENIRTPLGFYTLLTYFTTCSSVFVVNFEQVNVDWVNVSWN